MMDKKTIISAFRVAVAAACAISALSYGEEDPASIQHRYMTPSMRVSTNAWLSVSGNVERIVSAATNGLATAADVESKADKATTLAGYGITDAVPLVEDVNGEKTAVTIGSRRSDVTVGPYSIANGFSVAASGYHSHAEGYSTQIGEDDFFAYAWNGDTRYVYSSHGKGTYNINPVGGVNGFYIGEKTLSETISDGVAGKADTTNVYTTSEVDAKVAAVSNRADAAYSAAESLADGVNSLAGTIGTHIRDTKNPHKVTAAQVGAYTRAEVDSKIESAVLPTDPTFSNAVLSVGLNIDTNSVAVLNEIAETFGGFPVEGTATTVGGLLAALAAAVAWLRKKKIDKLTVTGMSKEVTANGGVAKLDDFFTDSNSLLAGTIESKVNSMFDNGDTTSYPRQTEG